MLFEHFCQLASDGYSAGRSYLVDCFERIYKAMGGLITYCRSWILQSICEGFMELASFFWEESDELELARRQARGAQRCDGSAWARNGGDGDSFIAACGDELFSGIGDARCAGVGDEGMVLPASEIGEDLFFLEASLNL